MDRVCDGVDQTRVTDEVECELCAEAEWSGVEWSVQGGAEADSRMGKMRSSAQLSHRKTSSSGRIFQSYPTLRVVMGCLTVVMGLLSLCDQAGSPIPAAMCDQPLNSSSSPSCVPASALFDCTPDCLGGTDESPAQCIALSTLDSVQQTALV